MYSTSQACDLTPSLSHVTAKELYEVGESVMQSLQLINAMHPKGLTRPFPRFVKLNPSVPDLSIPELINRVESESICYFCSDFCYGLHYVMPIWSQVSVLITPTLAQGCTRPGTLSPRDSHLPRDTLTQRHSYPGTHTRTGTLSSRDTHSLSDTLTQRH